MPNKKGTQSASGESPLAKARPRSFFGAPLCSDLEQLDARIAFLGVPFDQGTFNRPGARFGPDAIRDTQVYSYTGYPYGGEGNLEAAGYFDVDARAEFLKGITMADCGDVDIVPSDVVKNFERVTRAVETIVKKKAFPVAVGGDHAITFPVVRALSSFKPLDIVHFDAHMDYVHDIQGVLYTHGSPIRRCRELPFVRNITSIGVRRARKDAYEEGVRDGSLIISARRFKELGPQGAIDLVPRAENLYVTIDIDVMDPIQAPGTGTPETGGLFYYEMRDALYALARKGRIVAFDLVEVAPPYDWAQTTSQLAARLILDLLTAVFHKQDD